MAQAGKHQGPMGVEFQGPTWRGQPPDIRACSGANRTLKLFSGPALGKVEGVWHRQGSSKGPWGWNFKAQFSAHNRPTYAHAAARTAP